MEVGVVEGTMEGNSCRSNAKKARLAFLMEAFLNEVVTASSSLFSTPQSVSSGARIRASLRFTQTHIPLHPRHCFSENSTSIGAPDINALQR